MRRRELIDRWRTGDGRASAVEILRRLADGGSLRGLELPTVDGRLDLRGLPAGGLESEGAEVTGADLSYCTLAEASLDGVHWSQCRFDGADLLSAVFRGGSMTDCTLRRADLRDVRVVDARWDSVDLSGAKPKHFRSERTAFTDCTFSALAKVKFTACSLTDCRFTGSLNDTRFLGRGASAVLRNVTFSSSDFRYAEFDGVDFDNVTFPEDDSLIVVPRGFRAVAQRAGTLSSSRDDDVGKAVRRFLSDQFLRPGLSETAGWAVGRRDLTDGYPGGYRGGPEVAELAARTLHEAQEQLRTEGVIP